jgi:hypothetical protein
MGNALIVSTNDMAEMAEITPGAFLRQVRYECFPDTSPEFKELFRELSWKHMVDSLPCPVSNMFPLQWVLRVFIGRETAFRIGSLVSMKP